MEEGLILGLTVTQKRHQNLKDMVRGCEEGMRKQIKYNEGELLCLGTSS